MQLTEKKIFCCIFIPFLESTLNSKHFEKEMSLLSEVIDSDKRAYLNEKRSSFWKPFDSERVNSFQYSSVIMLFDILITYLRA